MVWTTCVALYFGITRAFTRTSNAGEPPPIGMLLHWSGWGIGAGTGLGGLWLCLARRCRGVRFPVHPGEYLWIAIGIRVAIGLAIQATWYLAVSADPSRARPSLVASLALQFVAVVFVCLVLLVAVRRIKIRRWRTFLLVLIVAQVLAFFWMAAARQFGGFLSALNLIPCGVLVVVVLMDIRQRRRYPWPHWVGVGLDLWLYVVCTGWLIWVFWFRQWQY